MTLFEQELLIRNIAHRTLPKIWVGTFLYGTYTSQRKDFELTLTVKWKLDISSQGIFGRKFLEICNHCGIKSWSRKTWKFCEQFLRCWKKIPLKLSLMRGSRPKSARANPPPTFGSHCSRLHPNRFTFGGVIAERVTRFCPVEYFQYESSNLYNKQPCRV